MAADPASLGQLAFTSLGSATVVALCNHLFTRRKTRAEADKLAAEAEKLRAETENLRAGFQNLASDVRDAAANCPRPPRAEIYRLDERAGEADFHDHGEKFHHQPYGTPAGTGSFEVSDGVLTIRKTNSEGRYRLKLRRYTFQGKAHDFLPGSPLRSSRRQLVLGLEAKVSGGHHTLAMGIKDHENGTHLALFQTIFDSPDWTPIEVRFPVPAERGGELWLDLQDVASPGVGSALRLREVVFSEER